MTARIDLPQSAPVWQLLAAVLMLQAIFWFVFSPLIEPTARTLDRLEIAEFAVATPRSTDWRDVREADFTAVSGVYEDCCEAGIRAVRLTFDLETIPDRGLGEVPVIGASNYETRLNGTLIFGEGRMGVQNPSYEGRVFRGYNRLPAGLLREGRNELVYTMVADAGTGGFFALPPTLGDYDRVAERFAFRRYLLNDYNTISVTIGYLVALLAFAAWVRGGHLPYLFWLGALSAVWATSLWYKSWIDPPFGGVWLASIGSAAVLAIPLAWVNLVNNWAGRSLRWVLPVSLAGYAIAQGASMFDIFSGTASESVERIGYWFIGGGALAFALLLLRKARGLPKALTAEFAIFLLCATLLLRDATGNLFDVSWGGGATDVAIPLLLAALAAAFVTRNIRLFRSQAHLTAELQTQLDQRTAELTAAHEREKAFTREQAHQDERRRIMRDMHDGMGSNLMAIMLAARRGKAEPEAVARGLQTVIDEMRLMIDSMDSVGESLTSALVLFRERADARVNDAGLAFEWIDQAQGGLPPLSPRKVLQVFRIMQEAITNAIKHSTGDRIVVTVAPTQVTVADNGADFAGRRRGGHGLDNMEARANAIGGAFHIEHSQGWTVARITLPQAAKSA